MEFKKRERNGGFEVKTSNSWGDIFLCGGIAKAPKCRATAKKEKKRK